MVRIRGAMEHSRRLKRIIGTGMEREIGKALFAAGQLIQQEAQLSITAGAVSGKNHEPSKPGEPPNADTHLLADNIEVVQSSKLSVEVSSNAPYSAALEFGSKRTAGTTSRSFRGDTTPYGPQRAKHGPVKVEFGDSKTAARPFMGPAAKAKRKEAVQLVRDHVAAAIRKSKGS